MILTGDFNSKIASKIVEKKRQIKTKQKTKKKQTESDRLLYKSQVDDYFYLHKNTFDNMETNKNN